MKKIFTLFGALLLCAAGALAQVAPGPYPGNPQQGGPNQLHKQGGLYYALGYASWQGILVAGNSATGSQSVIVYPQGAANGCVTLTDGTCIPMADVFNTNTPITVDVNSSAAEVVTPSAVSISNCPAGNIGVGGSAQCATITATFGNTHGQSAIVGSGDFGIEEAVTDASNQGGGTVYWIVDTGNVTLTGGATTTTTTKVPATFYGVGASAYVETTITTSTSWEVGITGSLTNICNNNTTLTAGTTCKLNSPALTGTGTTTLTAIVITNSTTPGAGVLKTRAWGFTPVQAAF